jgi:hypothetical protein
MILKERAQVEVKRKKGSYQWFMEPELLSWNVRGLNEGDKCLRVRNLLREWKVDIVCIQETKLEVMSCSIVRRLWGCHHMD